MKKSCSHEMIVYSFAVEEAERIAGTKILLVKGPAVLQGECGCGFHTNEVMLFGIYGDI